MQTNQVIPNGNRFVTGEHIFVPGKGTFFPSKEVAIERGTSPNGVGLWVKEFTFEDRTYYSAGNTNTWN